MLENVLRHVHDMYLQYILPNIMCKEKSWGAMFLNVMTIYCV